MLTKFVACVVYTMQTYRYNAIGYIVIEEENREFKSNGVSPER